MSEWQAGEATDQVHLENFEEEETTILILVLDLLSTFVNLLILVASRSSSWPFQSQRQRPIAPLLFEA